MKRKFHVRCEVGEKMEIISKSYLSLLCSSIAIGLLQIIALKFSTTELNNKFFRYLRTPSKEIVSEAIVACYLRKNIFRIMAKNAGLSITKIIKNKQVDPSFYEDLQAC